MKSFMILICLILNKYLVSSSFQTTLFQEINKEYKNQNIIISPLTAYQILALAANGAKGRTLNQILLALEASNLEGLNTLAKKTLDITNNLSTIDLAKVVMPKLQPNQAFLNTATLYGTNVESLKSVAQVNNWCNLKTHGKISTIIDSLDPNSLMILLNAIYFKGVWLTKFDESKTSKKYFYNFNKESKEILVDKMFVIENFNYYEDKQVQIVELPYKDDSMSALIILPSKDTNINNFISGLDDDKLQKLIKRMSKQTVRVDLPKFQLDFSIELNSFLDKMGIYTAFREESADFSGMIDDFLYINKVIQKSSLAIEEQGTVASKIIGAQVGFITVLPPSSPMIIDRPFLFIVKNNNLPLNYEFLMIAKIEEL